MSALRHCKDGTARCRPSLEPSRVAAACGPSEWPCPLPRTGMHRPASGRDKPKLAFGGPAGEHTDYGNVTLLATDAVGGLMVRDRNGRWLDAPVVADAFVCNIGDCLMRWTNDVYASTPHKVESPPGRHRYSVAFFLDPNP